MAMAKTILTKTQQTLLKELFSQKIIRKYFYLSGGTALSEYYLHHRYSEDLDFFTELEFDPMDIQIVLKTLTKKLAIKKIDYQQSFNRNIFYLHFGSSIVKTEFTFYPFEHIEAPKDINGVSVDSLIDIAVNKAFTIYQKPRSRDFIDLYLILKKKEWKFTDIRKKARVKFDTPIEPLQLAQALTEVSVLKDFPRLLISLNPKEWQNFWLDQAGLLKSEVLK